MGGFGWGGSDWRVGEWRRRRRVSKLALVRSLDAVFLYVLSADGRRGEKKKKDALDKRLLKKPQLPLDETR